MSIYLLSMIGIGLVDIGLGFGLVFATGLPYAGEQINVCAWTN